MHYRSARRQLILYLFLHLLCLPRTIFLFMTLPTSPKICSIKPLARSPISPSRYPLLLVDQTCTHPWSDVMTANENTEDGSVQSCFRVVQNLVRKISLLLRQIPKAWG